MSTNCGRAILPKTHFAVRSPKSPVRQAINPPPTFTVLSAEPNADLGCFIAQPLLARLRQLPMIIRVTSCICSSFPSGSGAQRIIVLEPQGCPVCRRRSMQQDALTANPSSFHCDKALPGCSSSPASLVIWLRVHVETWIFYHESDILALVFLLLAGIVLVLLSANSRTSHISISPSHSCQRSSAANSATRDCDTL